MYRYILIRSFLPFSRFFASGGRVRVDLATFFRSFLNWFRRIIDIFRVTNAFWKKTWQTARIHFYAVLVNEKRRQTILIVLENEQNAESVAEAILIGLKSPSHDFPIASSVELLTRKEFGQGFPDRS